MDTIKQKLPLWTGEVQAGLAQQSETHQGLSIKKFKIWNQLLFQPEISEEFLKNSDAICKILIRKFEKTRRIVFIIWIVKVEFFNQQCFASKYKIKGELRWNFFGSFILALSSRLSAALLRENSLTISAIYSVFSTVLDRILQMSS